ncbi:MAG: response regulator [Candidatus Omnitrophica bacterium]|nr:response regulator [Candidatus Omnitrophota bacterium]
MMEKLGRVQLIKGAVIAVGVLIFVVSTKFAFDSITAVSAYTVVGDVWVKAKQELIYNVKLYSATGEEKDYSRFRYFTDLLSVFRNAHGELKEKRPDRNVINEGFTASGISRGDAANITAFFSRFRNWIYIKKITEIWDESDLMISGLGQLGEELHQIVQGGLDGQSAEKTSDKLRILENIDIVNKKLEESDGTFIYLLSEVSKRITERVVYAVLIFVIVMLAVFIVEVVVERDALAKSMQFLSSQLTGDRARTTTPEEEVLLLSGGTAVVDRRAKIDGLYREITDAQERKDDQRNASEIFHRALKQARIMGEVKSRILTSMCEELKVPMKAILSFTDKLKETFILDEVQKNYIDAIGENSKTLIAYIDDVSGITGIEPKEIKLEEKEFDLHKVLSGIVEMLKFSYGSKAVTFDYRYDGFLPKKFIGDTIRISQIVLNLINNAVKKLEKGDISVLVEPGETKKDAGFSRQSPEREDNSLWHPVNLTVKYSGLGIKRGEETLFDSIIETDVKPEADGAMERYNITVSRAIIEKMGGHLAVKSGGGAMSEFRVTLNLKEARGDGQKLAEDDHKRARTRIKAVIVDPDKNSVSLIEKCLSNINVRVMASFLNHREVMQWMEQGPEMPEIILLDIMMPGLDILEFSAGLDKHHGSNGVRLIAMTPDANPGTARRVREAGFHDYIPKLLLSSGLDEMIQSAIEDGIKPRRSG